MTKLNIKLLAYQGAPEEVFLKAIKRIEKLINPEVFTITEKSADVLFFLSGGSELEATKLVSAGNFYLLIGSQQDNAYASATEVKAYLNEMNIASLLLDEEESETALYLNYLHSSKNALAQLQGKRLGQIGDVSDWLVSSVITPELLASKLGISLIKLPWNQLPHFSTLAASTDFLETFSETTKMPLLETAKVNALLENTIATNKLDAITVECFPMVQQDGVTACLPLARFNQQGIPAGCEGDLTAIAGMMLFKKLSGIVPWIANINKVTNDICMFSHCTIAPGMITDMKITTHFETNKGTAVEGNFKGDEVTIFRFDNTLSNAFITNAIISGRPKKPTACRTQIEVKLTKREVELLKENPLGNHHLIAPGNYTQLLNICCKMLGIAVQK